MKLLAVNEGSEAPNAMPNTTASPVPTNKDLSKTQQGHSGNSLKLNGRKGKCNLKVSLPGELENSNCIKMKSCINDSNNSNSMATNGVHNDIYIPSPKTNRIRQDSACIDEEDMYLEHSDSSHPSQLLTGINSLRRQGQFCDITLVLEEHEYAVHRAILAASSPYLFDYFSCLEDTAELTPTYKLKEVSHIGFEYLLDFMYTGSMCVPIDDVPVVYTTAAVLKMESAMRACAGFLAQHLTAANCLGFRRLIKDQEMRWSIDEYIRSNLSSIMSSKSFFGLTELKVEVVGLDEDIANESMERRLFSLVLDWAKNNLNDLKPKLDRLTEQVNVLYLHSDNTLRDCVDMEDTVMSSDDDMVQDYKIMARRTRSKNNSVNPQRMAPNGREHQPFHKFSLNPEEALSVADREWSIVATCKTNENTYFAITLLDGHLVGTSVHLRVPSQGDSNNGSSSGSGPNSPSISSTSATAMTLQANPSVVRKASIIPLEGMNNPRCALGAVAIADKLIVCGGYDRGECLSSVEEFSITENKWSNVAEMNVSRGRFSAADLDGYIYVCGGSDGWKELSCVERYDPASETWSFMTRMLKERSSHGVATLDGKLYCVGGCEGQRSIADCEVYDPSTNKWAKIAPLNAARSQTCLCAMNGLLFAIGGTDLWNTLNTVEVYDPQCDKWTLHSQLHIARRGAGVEFVNGKMVVVGGSDGVQSLVSTEIYDPTTEMWSVGPAMTVQRANLSAVAIKDRLFAIGGFSGKKFLNTLEWLDIESMEWFCHVPRGDVDGSGEVSAPSTEASEVSALATGSAEVKSSIQGDSKKETNCFVFQVSDSAQAAAPMSNGSSDGSCTRASQDKEVSQSVSS